MIVRPATHSGARGTNGGGPFELDSISCPLLLNSSIRTPSRSERRASSIDAMDEVSSSRPRSVYYSKHSPSPAQLGSLSSVGSPSRMPELSRTGSIGTPIRETQSAPAASIFADGRAPRRLQSLEDQKLEKFLILPPDRHLSKLWPHPLTRADPFKTYPHLNGGWACDECGAMNGRIMYHCLRTGNFDLCDVCVNWRGIIDSSNPDTEPLPVLPTALSTQGVSGKRRGDLSGLPKRQARLQDYEKGTLQRQEFFNLFRTEKHRIADLVGPISPNRRKIASASIVVRPISADEDDPTRARLARLYRSIDTDYSDEVSTRELWEGLAAAGMGMGREEVKRLITRADVDGSGALSMDEFVDCFAAKASKQCKPQDLVRVDAALSVVTKRSFMKREEINSAVWKYVEENQLKTGHGADAWIEFDSALKTVFSYEPIETPKKADVAGAEKKKKKSKKEAKPPGISHQDMLWIIDDRIDGNIKPIWNQLELTQQPMVQSDEEEQSLDLGGADDLIDTSCLPEDSVTTPRTAYLETVRSVSLAPKPLLIGRTCGPVMNLRHYGIGAGHGKSLGSAMKHMPSTITKVDLSHNGLADLPGSVLLANLKGQLSLVDLQLHDNALGRESAHSLETILAQPAGSVRIATLNLAKNKLGDAGCKSLASGLADNYSCKFLSLRENLVAGPGAAAFGQMLKENNFLEEVDLSWNCIRGPGSVLLAQSFEKNDHLLTLDLQRNALGNQGAEQFGKALEINKSLTKLDVSYNRISETGTQCLATAIRMNSTLLSLQLNGNPVGSEGGRAIMAALKVLGKNRDLGLQGCEFEETAKNKLLFNPGKPGGKYSLELGNPYDRMVAVNLYEMGCASTVQAWTKVKLDGKLVVECRKCHAVQKLATRCCDATCNVHMRALKDDKEGLNRQLVKDLGIPELEEFCENPRKEDPKYPVDKLLNTFPEELSKFILPDVGVLTLTYDDSGISTGEETAVDSTTFAHLTDLLLDEVEDLASQTGIDRASEAAALAAMDPRNFDDSKLRKAFALIDNDGSGFIDAEEFAKLCKKLDPGVTDINIAQALEAIDENGDGQVSAEEFVEWWRDMHGGVSDGREELLEDPEDGKDFNKTAKLIRKIDAACTSMSFDTAQAQAILDMADEGPPPVWKYHTVTAGGEDRFMKYSAQIQRRLEEAKTKNQQIVEIEPGILVDLEAMLQMSAGQWDLYSARPEKSEGHRTGQPQPPEPQVELTRPAVKVVREAGAGITPKVELICRMWTRITDSENMNPLLYAEFTEEEQKAIRDRLGELYYWDPMNPSGHYVLNLRDERQAHVARLLLRSAMQERKLRKTAGLPDLSQRGDGDLLRNVKLGGKSIARQLRKIPDKGTLELDYASTLLDGKLRTAPHKLQPASGDAWRMFRAEFLKALVDPKPRAIIARIRSAAKGLHFAAGQVLEMYEVCGRPELLVDMIVVLWGRTIDVHVFLDQFFMRLGAEPRLQVRFAETVIYYESMSAKCSHFALYQMCKRIGFKMLFNPRMPDGRYTMDLSVPEEREICEHLVLLAVEEPGENWRDEILNGKEFHLPVGWVGVDERGNGGVPVKGHVSLTFFTTFGRACQTTRDKLEKLTFVAERQSPIQYNPQADGEQQATNAKERWRRSTMAARPKTLSGLALSKHGVL
eukprot:SAG31_NODE_253_length_19063_cov_31.913362_11_plen_1652_part_00